MNRDHGNRAGAGSGRNDGRDRGNRSGRNDVNEVSWSFVHTTGRVTVNDEPRRCSDTTVMSPPWLRTIESTMVRPRPVP